MSEQKITYLTDVALLTIVVQIGRGDAILKAARDIGATTGAVGHYAKGIGARERLGLLGLAVEVEKDVISLFVSSEQRDAVMDHIYRVGGLDTPGVGYIYITPVEKVATFIPQSLMDRLEKSAPQKGET
jgi:nitrogen regulatory protein PII